MRFSHISLSALALAIATPALADPLPTAPTPDAPAAAATNDNAAPAPVAAAIDPATPVVEAPAMPDGGETAPPPPLTFNAAVTLVSDYRFRGISQTNKKFAVQGGMTVTHTSGLYASVWGSSIDDYIANGGDQEIDLIAGFKKTVKGTTFDIGVLYYYYPGSSQNCFDPGESGCSKYYSDFFEPYFDISHTLGPITGKVTVNYAFSQRALRLDYFGKNKDNLYGALDFSLAVPKTPLAFTAHLGHNFEKSFLSANRTYTDWGLGATLTYKQFTIGISYVDTDLPKDWVISGTGKDVAKAGIVGSVGVAF